MTETEDNFQRILVGVDQSADAQKAFHFAIRRAQQTHAHYSLHPSLKNRQ